MLDMVEKSVLQ